ncbi:unnamed protein product, partial [Aphanomyces euteiches]
HGICANESEDISSPDEKQKSAGGLKRKVNIETTPGKKVSPGIAIAKSIESLVQLEERKMASHDAHTLHNSTKDAVELLNQDYYDTLDASHLAIAYDIVLDP